MDYPPSLKLWWTGGVRINKKAGDPPPLAELRRGRQMSEGRRQQFENGKGLENWEHGVKMRFRRHPRGGGDPF